METENTRGEKEVELETGVTKFYKLLDKNITNKAAVLITISDMAPREMVQVIRRRWTQIPREILLSHPMSAFYTAVLIDGGPSYDTRRMACQDPMYAYFYAIHLDRGPSIITRSSARENPNWAFRYARDIDKVPSDEAKHACKIWGGACDKYWKWESEFEINVPEVSMRVFKGEQPGMSDISGIDEKKTPMYGNKRPAIYDLKGDLTEYGKLFMIKERQRVKENKNLRMSKEAKESFDIYWPEGTNPEELIKKQAEKEQ